MDPTPSDPPGPVGCKGVCQNTSDARIWRQNRVLILQVVFSVPVLLAFACSRAWHKVSKKHSEQTQCCVIAADLEKRKSSRREVPDSYQKSSMLDGLKVRPGIWNKNAGFRTRLRIVGFAVDWTLACWVSRCSLLERDAWSMVGM